MYRDLEDRCQRPSESTVMFVNGMIDQAAILGGRIRESCLVGIIKNNFAPSVWEAVDLTGARTLVDLQDAARVVREGEIRSRNY